VKEREKIVHVHVHVHVHVEKRHKRNTAPCGAPHLCTRAAARQPQEAVLLLDFAAYVRFVFGAEPAAAGVRWCSFKGERERRSFTFTFTFS
jgi:hypothetical protein